MQAWGQRLQKYEKEIELEMANEEVQISKIREMVKERNRQRHHTKAPPPKRRKLGDTTYSNSTEETATNSPAEKRKPEDAENPPVSKKARTGENIDIREMFRRQEEDAKTTAEGPGDAQLDQPAAHYGELEEVELTDWEEKFKQYREETVRLETEQEERIARAEKQEESWKLLRECIGYIKENETAWKREEEEKMTERQKLEKRNKQKQEEKRKQCPNPEKEMQKKITATWKLIPEHEQRQLVKEEERRRRMELREAKVNMWKRWRKETAEKKKETEEVHKTNEEKWLGKLEETLERLKKEVEDKKRAKEIYEERRKKLLADQKVKQEELLRKEQERKVRKQTKKMLEERWAMARWITSYIDENTTRWNKEQK